MKKLISVILCVLLLFSLCACNGEKIVDVKVPFMESEIYSQEDISENGENTAKGSFSIPTATSEEVDSDIEAREAAQLTDFPDLMAVLTDRRKRGEISEVG